jgi:hypothetical protein
MTHVCSVKVTFMTSRSRRNQIQDVFLHNFQERATAENVFPIPIQKYTVYIF